MRLLCVGLAAVGWPLVSSGVGMAADEASEFQPPVRLQADGRDIDTGEASGHSGPTLADVDGDGKRELVVGDFSGKFRVFPNVGTEEAPKFGRQRHLLAGGNKENPMADGIEAQVPIYCCIGSSPFFVDYDGDGALDMISGSYDPGECYLFRGWGKGQFMARETIVGADGKPVLRVPEQKQDYQSFGSWPVMVDWDNDGDLDLLVGGFDGTMFLRMNEGAREKPVLAATNTRVMVGAEQLKLPDGHAAPAIVDWDGDGRWDILSGSESGAVVWYRNVGMADAPALEAEKILIAKHEGDGYGEVMESGAEPVPGIRTQIAATDYNGDGKTDLLVGDYQSTITLRPDLTAAERAEFKRIQAESEAAVAEMITTRDALVEAQRAKYPGDARHVEEAYREWVQTYRGFQESPAKKALDAKVDELAKSMHEYLEQPETQGKLDGYEREHGYVWLYLRK